jgi:hypothetical protein
MPKHKKDLELVVDIEADEEEMESDKSVIQQFSDEIQVAVDIVIDNNMPNDIRIELIHVLTSIATQISIDFGISRDEFLGMANYFYEEGQKIVDEEEEDISKLN